MKGRRAVVRMMLQPVGCHLEVRNGVVWQVQEFADPVVTGRQGKRNIAAAVMLQSHLDLNAVKAAAAG